MLGVYLYQTSSKGLKRQRLRRSLDMEFAAMMARVSSILTAQLSSPLPAPRGNASDPNMHHLLSGFPVRYVSCFFLAKVQSINHFSISTMTEKRSRDVTVARLRMKNWGGSLLPIKPNSTQEKKNSVGEIYLIHIIENLNTFVSIECCRGEVVKKVEKKENQGIK